VVVVVVAVVCGYAACMCPEVVAATCWLPAVGCWPGQQKKEVPNTIGEDNKTKPKSWWRHHTHMAGWIWGTYASWGHGHQAPSVDSKCPRIPEASGGGGDGMCVQQEAK